MARTAKFRAQHDELLEIATALGALLDPSGLRANPDAARTCLNRLMAKLVLHLSLEDRVLYPELSSHPDAEVATIARRFAKEMGGTAQVVVDYNGDWRQSADIARRPEEFISQTQEILRVLSDRIERENRVLYTMADKVEGAQFA